MTREEMLLEKIAQSEIEITEQDIQNIENGITITDLDIRVMELEAKNEQV